MSRAIQVLDAQRAQPASLGVLRPQSLWVRKGNPLGGSSRVESRWVTVVPRTLCPRITEL